MEAEGIKAVKELVGKNVQGNNILDNLNRAHQLKENRYDNNESNIREYDPKKILVFDHLWTYKIQ